jgi:hypothetical protein
MADAPIDIRTGKPASPQEMARRAKVRAALQRRKTPEKEASGMPATGSGWGGGANGPGAPAGDLTEARLTPRVPAEVREAQADEMRDLMLTIAKDGAANPMVRVMAAEKFLDRVEGKAVARQIVADATGLEQWVLDSMGEPKKIGDGKA